MKIIVHQILARCGMKHLSWDVIKMNLMKSRFQSFLVTREIPQYKPNWFSCESWCSQSLQFHAAPWNAVLSPSYEAQPLPTSFLLCFFFTSRLQDRWSRYLCLRELLSSVCLLSIPVLLFLLFGCFWHGIPHLKPQKVKSGSGLDLRQALRRRHVSWRKFLI